jgi:Protein of unknown function (DUF3667)
MNLVCQNCNDDLVGNFCSSCGQKKYSRIDKKYIFDEIQYTFLHTNKGMFYSIKNILKNPGKTDREYIDGKRVNHYKPILLLFVLSGISTFISLKVIGLKEIMSTYYANQNANPDAMTSVFTFLTDYFTIITIAFVPFLALATKIVFKKMAHNYYEHLVMNTFIMSFYTLLNFILVYPLLYLFKSTSPELVMSITNYSTFFLYLIIYVLFFKEFYKNLSLGSILLKSLFVIGLICFQFIILFLVGFVSYALITKI